MKENYKFLAIAPSNGIQRIIEETIASREDVEVNCYVGSLQKGDEIVKEKLDETFDAVIARGATAQMIKQSCQVPVIEIRISFYDILQAVKLAENFHEDFVIVGFPAVTDNATLLRDLLRTDWKIHTIHTEEEADDLLPRLKQQKIRLVVSGMALDDYFKKYGFNYIQITTGSSSVAEAIQEALKVSSVFRPLREERNFYRRLLQENDSQLLLFDEHNQKVFSTVQETGEKYANSYAQRVLKGKNFAEATVQRFHGTDKITISQKEIVLDGTRYRAFYFRRTELPFNPQKNDVNIYTRDSAIRKFQQHQNESAFHWRENAMDIRQIAESPNPVMLIGEEGVGKGQLAASVYTDSGRSASQYYVIDFQQITDKYWSYLISSVDSPLNLRGWTIYFRDINALTPTRIVRLKNMVADTLPYTKNKIIFSCTTAASSVLPAAISTLINELCCLVLHILPLRERRAELESLSSIYVNSFNVEYAKQVSGFTPDALMVLQNYNWPGNLAQFKRILMQLVQSASSPYIHAAAVEKILNTEESRESTGIERLNLDKPLAELNQDIARMVLEKCGGNQTQASKQLGICRTTLWRMIGRK